MIALVCDDFILMIVRFIETGHPATPGRRFSSQTLAQTSRYPSTMFRALIPALLVSTTVALAQSPQPPPSPCRLPAPAAIRAALEKALIKLPVEAHFDLPLRGYR